LLEGLIQEGMTVFDVGAHVGTYTLMAARLAGTTGHVYAFEAEPENFSILKKNVELNGYRNVTCVPKAISNRSGLLTLYVSNQGNDRHTLIGSSTAESQGTPCEVEAISLDEFSASIGWPRVDVIKMDIEGAEPMAIEGMPALLSRSEHLRLVMEFAPDLLRASGVNPKAFLSLLTSNGFSISPVESAFQERLLQPDIFDSAIQEIEKLGAINLFCRRDSTDQAILDHKTMLTQYR
jgi:FkbM family methyltransferase